MARFPIPGGITREKLANIENDNVKRLGLSYTGESKLWTLIRGNTLEEFYANRQNMLTYLNSLTV